MNSSAGRICLVMQLPWTAFQGIHIIASGNASCDQSCDDDSSVMLEVDAAQILPCRAPAAPLKEQTPAASLLLAFKVQPSIAALLLALERLSSTAVLPFILKVLPVVTAAFLLALAVQVATAAAPAEATLPLALVVLLTTLATALA